MVDEKILSFHQYLTYSHKCGTIVFSIQSNLYITTMLGDPKSGHYIQVVVEYRVILEGRMSAILENENMTVNFGV